MTRLLNGLTSGQPARDLAFIAEVAAASRVSEGGWVGIGWIDGWMGGVDGIDGVGDGLTQQRLKILKKGGWMDGVDGWMGWGGWTDCGGGVARESGGMGWTGGWRGVSASELWTDSERVGWMGGHTKKNIHTLPPPLSPPSLLPSPQNTHTHTKKIQQTQTNQSINQSHPVPPPSPQTTAARGAHGAAGGGRDGQRGAHRTAAGGGALVPRPDFLFCLYIQQHPPHHYNHHKPPPPPPPQAGGPDDEEGEGKSKAITTSSSGPGGLSVIGQESLSSKQWEARRRQQGVAAVDRLLWAAGGAVEGMGAGAKRVAVVSRLLAVLGAGAARTPGGGEGEEMEGPTLPVVQQEGQEGYRAKANVGAIAALASSQGAVGEWLGGWVRVKGGRGGECGRLASLRLTPKKGQNTHTRPRPHPSLPPTSKPTTPAPPPPSPSPIPPTSKKHTRPRPLLPGGGLRGAEGAGRPTAL